MKVIKRHPRDVFKGSRVKQLRRIQNEFDYRMELANWVCPYCDSPIEIIFSPDLGITGMWCECHMWAGPTNQKPLSQDEWEQSIIRASVK